MILFLFESWCLSCGPKETRTLLGRESRERSRSPLRGQLPMNSIPNIDIVIVDEGAGSVAVDDEEGAGCGDAGSVDDFISPDAHALFVRGGGRGRRGVRGRGMRTRNLVGSHQWEVGHPLNEIWTTDADVPPELSLLAREVVSRRQRRANDDEDEFFDANDGSDSLLEGQDATFEWSPMDSFRGEEESLKPERTGSTLPFASAYDAFRAYWDNDILSLIVTETNHYAIKIVLYSSESLSYHHQSSSYELYNLGGLIAKKRSLPDNLQVEDKKIEFKGKVVQIHNL
ncbi:hypothetical protein ABMA27_000358 [Loxostege sticticalis]|uniref:Uncharacterized protein n=1 Tax=Loxostege sticticalis TaxID=481309 RepID=A0ABR3IN56_LOXSC